MKDHNDGPESLRRVRVRMRMRRPRGGTGNIARYGRVFRGTETEIDLETRVGFDTSFSHPETSSLSFLVPASPVTNPQHHCNGYPLRSFRPCKPFSQK